MSSPTDQRVTCPTCGAAYRWAQTAAGKKIKCRCEAVFRMPAMPNGPAILERPGTKPAARQNSASRETNARAASNDDLKLNLDIKEEDLNLYDLASADFAQQAAGAGAATSASNCPSCHKVIKPGAVLCVNCGFNLQSGQSVQGAGVVGGTITSEAPLGGMFAAALSGRSKLGQTAEQAKAMVDRQFIIDYHLPVCLVFLGLVLTVARGAFFDTGFDERGVAISILVAFLRAAFYVPFYLTALFVAAKIMGTSFGNISAAAIKLVAIMLVPAGVYALIGHFIPEVGWLLGWVASLGLYYALLHYLFELDPGEAFTLIIIFMVFEWVAAFLFVMLAVMGVVAIFG